MKKQLKKFFIILSSLILIGVVSFYIFWLLILPNFIKSDTTLKLAQKLVIENLKMDLKIKNPTLKTYLRPKIDFKTDEFLLLKNNEKLVELKNFNISLSFYKILFKEIKLDNLSAKTLVVKADRLIEEFNKLEKKEAEIKPSDIKFDYFSAPIALENFNLSYLYNGALLDLSSKNIFINNKKGYNTLNFDLDINLYNKNKKYLTVKAVSDDDIKLFNDKLQVEDFIVKINNSKIKLNSKIDINNINLNVKSDKFLLEDIFNIINSNVIIPDGSLYLAPLVNPEGFVSFDLDIKNEDIFGSIGINNTKASLKDLSNIPLNIEKGKIKITPQKVDFLDLKGYWGKSKNNSLKISGDIKDYYKSFDSDLVVDTVITNEFFHNYLYPLINFKLYIQKPSPTRIIYKSKNGIMDIVWLAKINKGVNFGADENKSALSDYDRALKGDFNITGNKLDIKNINYYIANDIKKGVKLTPILILDGLMGLDGKLEKFGFSFGRKMPCEFLNIFTGFSTFKKGTIEGDFHLEFINNIPYIKSNMIIKDTFIPSQRLKISKAIVTSDKNNINLDMSGRFKKANYIFQGNIKNGLVAPYTIKNLKLDIDEIDIQRFLASMNNQQNAQQIKDISNEADENADDDFMFDTNLIKIEKCNLTLKKGKYKELEFGNIDALLTLINGNLKITSNRFDIAEGTSSLKVDCDLKNLKYNIILGVKNINSNLMAKVLFNLDKEITGLASGIIKLNCDKTLKMNGDMKFIVNDGIIGKIGLVEYVLKIASLFRNPIVMISPGTVMDIVSIPEGRFDTIKGELKIKDNVIKNINIKSSSKTLSALIRGRFDFERHDASLRIYTRFSTDKNSIFSFLRNMSLNALANKVQMNTRNDANYYESELVDLPEIEVSSDRAQIFLTTVEGDVENNNFLSSLKKLK